MKKSFFNFMAVIIISLTGFSACYNLNNSDVSDGKDGTNGTGSEGKTEFNLFVPDYYNLAESSRVILPSTANIRFSYYNSESEKWTVHSTLDLSSAEKNTVGNAPSDFPGSYYTIIFEKIPCGIYGAGEFKVELTDSSDNVLSCGTNDLSVEIKSGQTSEMFIYLAPSGSTDCSSGSLAAGEMKFFTFSVSSGKKYTLKVSVGSGDSYPDVVVFDSKWSLSKYYSVDSAEDAEITWTESSEEGTKYIAVWADDGQSISSYELKVTEKTAAEKSIPAKVDFSESLDTSVFSSSGPVSAIISKDPVYSKWAQYGDALIDTHGPVYELCYYNGSDFRTASLRFNVTVDEESAVSFEYKTDMVSKAYLKVYVDSVEKISVTGCSGEIWKTATCIVSSGSHIITIAAESPDRYYGSTLTNAVYIDNLTVAANTVASVDISPKGLQETYAGGFDIPFTAKALRSDGTEISGKTVNWSGAENGIFSPSAAGTYTVCAEIDGITVQNNTVKVHEADYFTDSVTLAGNTFTGTISNEQGDQLTTENCTFESPTPAYTNFSADGFFVLKGTSTKDFIVYITKDNYRTYYFIPSGNFENRIWLRFGQGEYTIFITESSGFTYATVESGYQGDYKSLGTFCTGGSTTCKLTVTNTNSSYTAAEASYLLPSSWCESDDFKITNAYNAIRAELDENASTGQILAAIHDWEIHRMHYDNVSLTEARKIQDALHVYEYSMGVCEGYANLYAAMARLAGVQSTIICGNDHAWNNIYYGNQWLLLDATWDDPVSSENVSNVEKNPTDENYTYFLITEAQDTATGYDHSPYAIAAATDTSGTKIIGGDGINDMRSILSEDDNFYVPHINGMPEGWY